MPRRLLPLAYVLVMLGVVPIVDALSQRPEGELLERFRSMSARAEAEGLAEPFVGVTTDGTPVPGLFPVRATGVSTEPVRDAASAFLASLSSAQRDQATFAVDDDEWRKWMNQHFYLRQGVGFEEMTEPQRDHQRPANLRHLSRDPQRPTRDHVHTVVRTPNGNDYGKDLLRQHYEAHPHPHEH